MTYQHQIIPVEPRLEVRVRPEVHGYLAVEYRIIDPRFAHVDDWKELPHCTDDESRDVVAAVLDGFLADLAAQQAW